MPGPAPAEARFRRKAPARGDWRPAPGIGWQHGITPKPPVGLTDATRTAWAAWMASWVAAHWAPHDLPALRVIAHLYDRVARGEYQRAGELRLWLDGYGLTPSGQQSRRWQPPRTDLQPVTVIHEPSPYAGLRLGASDA